MKIRSLLLGLTAAALLSAGSAAAFASDSGMAASTGSNMIISTSADLAAPMGDGWLLAKNDPKVVDPGGTGGAILWFNGIVDVAALDKAIIPLDPWKPDVSMIDVADTSQLCGDNASTGSGDTPMHSGVALGHTFGADGWTSSIAIPTHRCPTFGSAGSGLS